MQMLNVWFVHSHGESQFQLHVKEIVLVEAYITIAFNYFDFQTPDLRCLPKYRRKMTTSTNSQRVLIIGGGLAGLSLAQGLKKTNIPFRIFERDTSSSFRAQGYRVRIGPDGATALKHLLPDHLWQAFEATCADIVHGGNRLDAKTGEVTVWQRGPPPSRPTVQQQVGRPAIDDKAYNADRAILRSVLLSGLQDDIGFGKKFERYDVASDDKVIAYFNDGSSEKGTLLIGADGIRSVVRKQLLPGMYLLDTEGRAVFGKTVLTGQLREKMAPQIGDGIALAAESEESRMKLFTDGMSWNREHASKFAHNLDIELPDDYIYWVLVFRKDIVNSEQEKSLLMLSNEQSAKLAFDLTSTWKENIRVLLDLQTVEAAATLAFLTSPPDFDTAWSNKSVDARSRVTLIGDSAHAMPPVVSPTMIAQGHRQP